MNIVFDLGGVVVTWEPEVIIVQVFADPAVQALVRTEILGHADWLALDRPTIADIACMPYMALSHEGGLSLEPYPAIRAWIRRIKALPGFITMPAL